MRRAFLVVLAMGCAAAPPRALSLGAVERAAVASSPSAPCDRDRAGAGGRWTFVAPARGRYAARAEGWLALALSARDASGETRCEISPDGAAVEIVLELDEGEAVELAVDGANGERGTYRISMRELVPLAARVGPEPVPDRVALLLLTSSAAPFALDPEDGESDGAPVGHELALEPVDPREAACGARIGAARALLIEVPVTSALALRAGGDVVLEVRRAAEAFDVVGCALGHLDQRIAPGRYVIVVGAAQPAAVTLEATITVLLDPDP